ncbi:YdeI family protein [Saccharicrinis sp. FJH62]|uniref:YdeI/OmpD-associated family protein n=1 Tax=Saccharicrinis sp. FJH62 TaxID=3344657 RepID=UPI0035D4AD02
MNPEIDIYLSQGCMRCEFGGTPQCKVHNWTEELNLLRMIILDCGLNEELKWGVPCYTWHNKNVAIMSAFREYCALSFFKGSLLKDPERILDKPGENSQAGRLIKFTNIQQIIEKEPELKAFIHEAIELEKEGREVKFKTVNEYAVPEELQHKLDEEPVLRQAFEALTPGRQKGYLIYFSQPKQSKTRETRIEKCIPRILEGKGLHDH